MPMTPEQIYDRVEAQWSVNRLRRRTKFRRRTTDVLAIVVVQIAVLGFLYVRKLDYVVAMFCISIGGWMIAEARRRWALEDRIEALEQRK